MAQIRPPLSFLLLLLLTTSSTTAAGFSFWRTYTQYKTAFSLSHSLITRVSNLRAARGDISGANRAKAIAQKLERGLGFWGLMWSVGWDYAKNYAWRDLDYRELHGVVSDLNQLLGSLGELTRAESNESRADWAARNYRDVVGVANSVLRRLVKVFGQSAALKEVVETVQKEVVEGEMLRDCLELGSNDLKGLVQIIKDFTSQFYSTPDYNHNADL